MQPAGTPAPGTAAEFRFIERHFLALAGPGALRLSDDAAVFAPPRGREIVVSADAMVQGVHFLPDDPADSVGRKLLRVNLSDLAAMGATPLGYLLTVTLPPSMTDPWFAGFCAGLAADQTEYGLSLLGGDTTSTSGPLVLSLTIIGHVAPGTALRRNGARAGDGIWVSGSIGDAALGLVALQGGLADPSGDLAARYRVPRPRVALGQVLHGIASAAMDVSDGLVQDCGHLCRQSGVAAIIEEPLVPLSEAARAAVRSAGPQWHARCLTGGDDYELLLAVPAGREAALQAAAATATTVITRIGRFEAGAPAVQVLDAAGRQQHFARPGWSHI